MNEQKIQYIKDLLKVSREEQLETKRLNVHRSIAYIFAVFYPLGVYFYIANTIEPLTIEYYIKRMWMWVFICVSLLLSYKYKYVKDRFANFLVIGIMGVIWFQTLRAGTPGITPMAQVVLGICFLLGALLYMSRSFVYIYFTFITICAFVFSYNAFPEETVLHSFKNTGLFVTLFIYPFRFHLLRLEEQQMHHDEVYLRKEAEKYFKEVLDSYEGLSSAMPIQMAILSNNLTYIFVNKASDNHTQLIKRVIGKDDYYIVYQMDWPNEIAKVRTETLRKVIDTKEQINIYETINGIKYIRHYVPSINPQNNEVNKIFTFAWEV